MSFRGPSSPLYIAAALCLFLVTSIACLSADEAAASTSPKIYSPFDEKKPKIPAEILSDKRLDKKVTISVKSRNMKDLFAEVRKQTGVSVVVAKELSGERPIVFFHDKPLRDVMVEISGLFGYYWLTKGRKDAWTYELFEDRVHAKRRDQVRDARESAQVEALLDCIDQASEALKSDAGLERLSKSNERLYRTGASPGKTELLKFIKLMDRDTIRGFLNDAGMTQDFKDMSAEMRSGVIKAINCEYIDRDPTFTPLTAEQMQSGIVQLKRWRMSLFTPPHVMLVVAVPPREDGTGGMRAMCGWPAWDEGEPDLLTMPEAPPGQVIGDPVPDAKITIEKKHEVLHYGAILLQDALAAIAEQAKLNVVADYYFQEAEVAACTDERLDKLVPEFCLKMGYTCQVEKGTLRFRCNKWYLQPLQDEPPSKFQESLWQHITDNGALTLDDLLDIACLPDQQTFWGGFRFIPQAQQARLFPRTARLVRMLGSILEDEARTPKGLPVSKLDADQFSRLADWAGVMGIKETQEGLLKSTILLEITGDPETNLKFTLVLPDGTHRNVALSGRLQPFDETARRTLATERAAELAADKIELSPATAK